MRRADAPLAIPPTPRARTSSILRFRRTAYTYQYATDTGQWSKTPIIALPCNNPNQGSLLPRDAGYTVGQTVGPLGDRLLVLGGNDQESNVRGGVGLASG